MLTGHIKTLELVIGKLEILQDRVRNPSERDRLGRAKDELMRLLREVDKPREDRNADKIDGYDRDDIGENPDY
jgi:hypothetical protein